MLQRLRRPSALRKAGVVLMAVAAIAWVVVTVPAGAGYAAPPDRRDTTVATVNSFAADVLHGDNGLPTSPAMPPLRYGPINTPVDVNGDAIDAHEGQDIEYFDGTYYLYGVRYGCGTHIDLSDDAPFCGFSAYRSDDLMHWQPVGMAVTPQLRTICASYCGFPKVIFSPRLGRYLLYFSSDNGGNFNSHIPSSRWLADSTSAVGPWQDLHEPKLRDGGSDAYSLAIGRDGAAYMVDFTMSTTGTDIWVDRLNADYTASAGSATMVTTGAYQAVAMFQRGAYWYLTLSQNALYYGPAALVYLRSTSPLGPWTAPDGGAGPVPLTADSCGGTAQSVAVLPSSQGAIAVELIDLYRSSPGDVSATQPPRVPHGDWNQAIAGRYWAPLAFDADAGIAPITCTADTRIPLARPVAARQPAVEQADCRITAGSTVEQSWTVPADDRLRRIQLPVFQRGFITDPRVPAPTQPPTAIDAPLTVELATPQGTDHWTIQPGDVSWAPKSVTLTLPRTVKGGSRVTLRLHTAASDGCFGVLIESSTGDGYSAIVNGEQRAAPGVRLVFRFRSTRW